MTRALFTVLLAVTMAACGNGSSSSVSPTAPSAPVSHSLSGTVTVSGTTVGVSGITIAVLDGPNAGRETVTGSGGRYELANMQTGNANVAARANGWEEHRAGITVSGASTLNFSTRTVTAYQLIGIGSRAFDIPAWVTRVAIVALYDGFCENFIVHIGGRLVVNEILGRCGIGREFSGSFNVTGTNVEVRATGVGWGIGEIRSAATTALLRDQIMRVH